MNLCIKTTIVVISLCAVIVPFSLGQPTFNYPEFSIQPEILEQHLRFLASDELQGRKTGTKGNDAAARYIAEQFRMYGVNLAPGQTDFFQPINFLQQIPGGGGSLTIDNQQYIHGDSMLWLSGDDSEFYSEATWLGHGWIDEKKGYNDYQGKDVEGKVVIVASGTPDSRGRTESLQAMPYKRQWAVEHGATAIIEIYQINAPWPFFRNYFKSERLDLIQGKSLSLSANNIPHGWVFAPSAQWLYSLKRGKQLPVKIHSQGSLQKIVSSKNVVGVIPGSDEQLKEEYVMLTAHYDHIGIRSGEGRPTVEDSIFNGARDNGMGVISLLAAAQSLAKLPAKRSIILIAFTAEEIGLLGSAYYAENPFIPLEKVVFCLNNDGAGYTDTSAVSILGYDRVGVTEEFNQATSAFNLRIYPDPAKEQNLFDRSDNVSFAQKGIPAPTFSPGFEKFDDQLFKYYHQVNDEVDSINWGYLHKFAQAFTYSARLIANKVTRPFWVKGDKYEQAGYELYRK